MQEVDYSIGLLCWLLFPMALTDSGQYVVYGDNICEDGILAEGGLQVVLEA